MPPTSKLRAARTVALNARVAAAAAALLAALILAAILATDGRGEQALKAAGRAADAAGEVIGQLSAPDPAALGPKLATIHLQGSTSASREDILHAVALRPGQPILGLDLDAIRARVERVAWVQQARVIRLLPDTLVIAVVERPLMAVWQHRGVRQVVAANGAVAASLDPRLFPTLPLIVGDDANLAAAAMLPTIQARPRLVTHLAALRRVDRRRWDLILKNGGVILLQSDDPAGSLARLDRLDHTARILDLGFERIDLRNPDYTLARPRGGAPKVVSHGV
jgi:cell division protein FtsQ